MIIANNILHNVSTNKTNSSSLSSFRISISRSSNSTVFGVNLANNLIRDDFPDSLSAVGGLLGVSYNQSFCNFASQIFAFINNL